MSRDTSTIQAAKWCKELGLDLFEYSFGRGINISDKPQKPLAKNLLCKAWNFPFTLLIILISQIPTIRLSTIHNVTKSIEKAKLMNAERVVFHTLRWESGKKQAVEITKNNLKSFIDAIEEKQLKNFILCPETMGKMTDRHCGRNN